MDFLSTPATPSYSLESTRKLQTHLALPEPDGRLVEELHVREATRLVQLADAIEIAD